MALRLKREDYDSVKHDRCFSEWTILVGPSDWKEQATGREATDRFRSRNLPSPTGGSGIYELGVTLPAWKTVDRHNEHGIVKSEDVIVVYVGHADNIRKRLQRYGQAGAHLEGTRSLNSSNFSAPTKSLSFLSPNKPSRSSSVQFEDMHMSNGEESIVNKLRHRSDSDRHISSNGRRHKNIERQPSNFNISIPVAEPVFSADSGARGSPRGPRLFSEVFALGCSIAYRWSSTKTKDVAEFLVSELTDAFDYAWNRGGNSDVRSQDILGKIVLGKRGYGSACCSINNSKWSRLVFKRKIVGIKILGAHKPLEARSRRRSGQRGIGGGLYLVLKKSPHMMIMGGKSAKHCEFTKIDIPVDRCGVLLDNGLVCNALPQKGRKRCPIHVDMRKLRQRKSSQVAAQDSRSGSLASDSYSIDSCSMDSHNSRGIPARSAPSSPCFPFLTTKKMPKAPEDSRKRGSVSFNTWLSKGEILKVKSFEWLLAMEEIKGRGNNNNDCSTSPILKPEVLSPDTKPNEENPVRVSRISLNLSPVMETVREQPTEQDVYSPTVDNGMPHTIVSWRSSVRWPPASLRDSYVTTNNLSQFPRISFS